MTEAKQQRVFRLLHSTLELQEKIEAVKYSGPNATFFSQRCFHLPFYRLSNICSSVLFSSISSTSSSVGVAKLNGQWLTLAEQCIGSLLHLVANIISKENNYFGVRNEKITESECSLVVHFLVWLVEQPWDQQSSLMLGRYFGATSLLSKASGLFPPIVDEDPIGYIFATDGCIVTKLFWLKYFPSTLHVYWHDFEQVFVDEYRLQDQSYALRTWRELLTGTSHGMTTAFGSQMQVVSYASIALLNYQHDRTNETSIFHLFQQRCDPQTTVVVMGQLMDHTSIVYPRPTIVQSLLGHRVTQISCGDQHMAVIVDPGMVYTWGKGIFGRLGLGHEFDVSEPQLVTQLAVTEPHAIVQVSCGFALTGFVSGTGKLFMCGAGMNGRLGLGVSEVNFVLPQPVTALAHEHVVKVQNGSVHSVMLTKSGRVYSCGKADFTGHGGRTDVLTPLPVVALSAVHIVDISVGSGGFHSLALSNDGQLYSWGHNRVGQLGIIADPSMPRNDDGGYFVPIPQRVHQRVPGHIARIAAGWGHSCVMGDHGDVYLCGRSVENQLGLGDTGGHYINERGHRYQPLFQPSRLGDLALVFVSNVACGGEHTLFHTSDYEVVGVGLNRFGQLGGEPKLPSVSRPNGAASTTVSTSASTSRVTADHHLDIDNEGFYALPRQIPYFQQEKRVILSLSCGFSCSMVLMGARQPASLRVLCTRTIQSVPELRHMVADWRQQSRRPERSNSSQRYGASAFSSMDNEEEEEEENEADEVEVDEEESDVDQWMNTRGCYFSPETLLYHDMDRQQTVGLIGHHASAVGDDDAPLTSTPICSVGMESASGTVTMNADEADEAIFRETILNALR